jgi:O-antigen ligase
MPNSYQSIHPKDRLSILFIAAITIGLFIPNPAVKNILIGASTFFSLIQAGALTRLVESLKKPTAYLILGYFSLYIFGFLWSDNLQDAQRLLGNNLPLLVVPIAIGALRLNKQVIQTSLLIFAYSTLLFALGGIGYRTWFYFNEVADTGYFYNDNIVDMYGFQAVYYAIYVNISVLIILQQMVDPTKLIKIPKVIHILSILLLIAINFLLASRMSMATLYLSLGAALLIFIIQRKKYLLGTGLMLAGIVMIAGLLFAFPKTLNRFESIKNTQFDFENTNQINHFNGEIDEANWNGLTTRLAIWSCAKEAIQGNIVFGTGPGDFQDVLIEKYEEKNFHFGLHRNFSTHNMYLRILLMYGVIGLLFFLVVLFTPLILAIKHKQYLLVAFLLFVMLAMLTEDVLARNQGIVFFALIWGVLAMGINSNPNSRDYQLDNEQPLL